MKFFGEELNSRKTFQILFSNLVRACLCACICGWMDVCWLRWMRYMCIAKWYCRPSMYEYKCLYECCVLLMFFHFPSKKYKTLLGHHTPNANSAVWIYCECGFAKAFVHLQRIRCSYCVHKSFDGRSFVRCCSFVWFFFIRSFIFVCIQDFSRRMRLLDHFSHQCSCLWICVAIFLLLLSFYFDSFAEWRKSSAKIRSFALV